MMIEQGTISVGGRTGSEPARSVEGDKRAPRPVAPLANMKKGPKYSARSRFHFVSSTAVLSTQRLADSDLLFACGQLDKVRGLVTGIAEISV